MLQDVDKWVSTPLAVSENTIKSIIKDINELLENSLIVNYEGIQGEYLITGDFSVHVELDDGFNTVKDIIHKYEKLAVGFKYSSIEGSGFISGGFLQYNDLGEITYDVNIADRYDAFCESIDQT